MVAASADSPGQGLSGRAIDLVPTILGLAVLLVAFGVAFFPTLKWILGEWSGSSGVLSHGYLVAAISAYFFVRAVPEAARLPVKASWWALPLLLVLSIVWLLGKVSTVIAIQSIVLPAILLVAITVVFGMQISRLFAFPVLFLYLAVPAVEHLQFIFQAITVWAVSVLIRLADMPALMDGNFVILPQGVFEIAGGCSGLNFVVAGLSLAILYGRLFYTKTGQRARLIALTLSAAMLGNWLRVFAIIVIGYQSGMNSPLVNDHLTFGWIIFAILMVPVYVIARRMESSSLPKADQRRPIDTLDKSSQSSSWLVSGAATIAMIAGPIWANTISKTELATDQIAIQFPAGESGWLGPSPSLWDWEPQFSGADTQSVVQYQHESGFILVYANIYLSQEQDRELIAYNSNVGGKWAGSEIELLDSVSPADGVEFGQSTATNYAGDWLIWFRYQNGDVFDATAQGAKLSQAMQALKGNTNAGIVAFATLCDETCDAASRRLVSFFEEVGYSINFDSLGERQ